MNLTTKLFVRVDEATLNHLNRKANELRIKTGANAGASTILRNLAVADMHREAKRRRKKAA